MKRSPHKSKALIFFGSPGDFDRFNDRNLPDRLLFELFLTVADQYPQRFLCGSAEKSLQCLLVTVFSIPVEKCHRRFSGNIFSRCLTQDITAFAAIEIARLIADDDPVRHKHILFGIVNAQNKTDQRSNVKQTPEDDPLLFHTDTLSGRA